MDLQDELDRVIAELDAAQREIALLGAKVHGLTAQRDALAAAIQAGAAPREPGTQTPLSTMRKDDAIVAVLRQAGRPLTTSEIVSALRAAGRANENYNGISVYLTNLTGQERVRRVGRGLYAAVA